MKRVAILAVYDSEGIVHEYLEYYIESFREVALDIIIVVIGYMADESLNKLRKYSSEIYIKENKGYDAAAYKYVFTNYLSIDRLNQYDEMILSNDTCFGPFKSFACIFNEMEKKPVDFWGLRYANLNYISYLVSHFIVLKKNIFRDVHQYFENKVDDEDDKKSVCVKFEQGLFKYLIERKFEFDYYGERKGYSSYRAPDYSISEEHNPLLKKRCFEQGIYNHENCIGALKYIHENTDYDIRMILDYVRRKYNIAYDIDEEFRNHKESSPYFSSRSICDQQTIQLFCKKNKEIYIYGAGEIASEIYSYYRENLDHMKAFIVSDDQIAPKTYFDKKVFKISEIDNKLAGIIVGVSKTTTDMVRSNLSEFKNVLYLW